MNQSQQGKAKMHVGVQGIGTSKPELQFLVRHGYRNLRTNHLPIIPQKVAVKEASVLSLTPSNKFLACRVRVRTYCFSSTNLAINATMSAMS